VTLKLAETSVAKSRPLHEQIYSRFRWDYKLCVHFEWWHCVFYS